MYFIPSSYVTTMLGLMIRDDPCGCWAWEYKGNRRAGQPETGSARSKICHLLRRKNATAHMTTNPRATDPPIPDERSSCFHDSRETPHRCVNYSLLRAALG